MTSEEKLKAIIEAQVKGGYERYACDMVERGIQTYEMLKGTRMEIPPVLDGWVFALLRDYGDHGEINIEHVLAILLDTEGCKAAYVEEMNSSTPGDYRWNSRMILEQWHSEEGNNSKAAIHTAYELLP